MAVPSVVGICNRALQKLGVSRITALTDDSNNARACDACYEPLRDALLREFTWGFAIKRATLAASSTSPEWGRARAFPLPSDYVALAPDYEEDATLARDYLIENGQIISDWTDPLYLRYVSQVTDPRKMDALFRELLAHDMAIEMCDELTQSLKRKDALIRDRDALAAKAKKAQSKERPAVVSPDSSWITSRM